jgi:hypothetical protein
MSKACDTLGTEQQVETAVLGASNTPAPLSRATMALPSDPNKEWSKTTNDISPSKAAACGGATNIKSAAIDKVLDSSTILSRQEVRAKQSSRSGSSQKKSASQATLSKSSAFYPPSRELGPYERRSKSPDSIDEEKKEDTSSSIRLQSERMEHVTNMVVTDPYGDQGSFTGVLIRGKPDSYGTMIYKDGRVYSGSWQRGRWNGHGHVIFANGDTYTGDYVRDQRHGVGRYEWSDGRVYDGRFERDQRHGHGIYSWPDDSMYSGEFCNGVRHGLGTFTYPDGSVYNGTWRDGKQNGHGECVWADGRCFRGDWVDGHARFGVEVRADGTIRHNGLWKHDRPVRKNGRSSDDSKKKTAITKRETSVKRAGAKMDHELASSEGKQKLQMDPQKRGTDRQETLDQEYADEHSKLDIAPSKSCPLSKDRPKDESSVSNERMNSEPREDTSRPRVPSDTSSGRMYGTKSDSSREKSTPEGSEIETKSPDSSSSYESDSNDEQSLPTSNIPEKLQATDACNTTVSKKSRIASQHRDRVAKKPSDHKRGESNSMHGSRDSRAAWYTNQLLRSLSPPRDSSIALLLNTDSRESSEFDNDSGLLEEQSTTEFEYCRQPSGSRQLKRSSRLLRYQLKMKHAACR